MRRQFGILQGVESGRFHRVIPWGLMTKGALICLIKLTITLSQDGKKRKLLGCNRWNIIPVASESSIFPGFGIRQAFGVWIWRTTRSCKAMSLRSQVLSDRCPGRFLSMAWKARTPAWSPLCIRQKHSKTMYSIQMYTGCT